MPTDWEVETKADRTGLRSVAAGAKEVVLGPLGGFANAISWSAPHRLRASRGLPPDGC